MRRPLAILLLPLLALSCRLAVLNMLREAERVGELGLSGGGGGVKVLIEVTKGRRVRWKYRRVESCGSGPARVTTWLHRPVTCAGDRRIVPLNAKQSRLVRGRLTYIDRQQADEAATREIRG